MSRFTRATTKNLMVVVMVGATIYMLIDIMKEDESAEENPILKRKGWRKEEFQHPGEISEKERQEFRDKIEKLEKVHANALPQDGLVEQLFKGIPGGPGGLMNMDPEAMKKYSENLKEFQASNEILRRLANRRNEIIAKKAEKQNMMENLLGIDTGHNALSQLQNGGAGPQQVGPGQLQFNPPQNGFDNANLNPGFQNSIIDPLHPDKFAQLQQLLNGMNQGNVWNPNVPQNEFKGQPMGLGGQPQPNQLELLNRLMEMQNHGIGNSPNNELGNLPPYPGNNIPNPPNEYQNNPVNVNNLPPYPSNKPTYIGHMSPNNGNPLIVENGNLLNMGNSPDNNFPNMDSLPYNPRIDPHMTDEAPHHISSETNAPPSDEGETPPSDEGETPPSDNDQASYNTGEPQVETEGHNPETKQSHSYSENTEVDPQVQTEGSIPETKESPSYLENSEMGLPREEWAPDNHPSEVPVNREYEEPQPQH